jgi:hypothetical protein
MLSRKPFRPLVLSISNGKKYEIRHPELAQVGLSLVWFDMPNTGPIPLGTREVAVALRHIVEVEVGSAGSTSGNGAAS